jgi:hypothetical protein
MAQLTTMTEEWIMEMGKLTAKLRDAVPVCFLVEGKEIKRYKNIEIPDELKKLEYQDFKFDVPALGAITFKIIFEPSVLPEEFPQAQERRTRKTVADSEKASEESQPGYDIAEATPNGDPIEAPSEMGKGGDEAIATTEEPAIMEIAYHVTGECRKELVKAISQFIGMPATYQNAPTFAFAIGNYTVDKSGTLTGEYDASLMEALAEQGFIAG